MPEYSFVFACVDVVKPKARDRVHATQSPLVLRRRPLLIVASVHRQVEGVFIFALIYIVLTVVLFPCSILTVLSGLLFGLPIGIPTVVLSATAGSVCSFLLGRCANIPNSQTFLQPCPAHIPPITCSLFARTYTSILFCIIPSTIETSPLPHRCHEPRRLDLDFGPSSTRSQHWALA